MTDPLTTQPDGQPQFQLPAKLTTAGGTARRVGVEVEFAGLAARPAALALRDRLGGMLEERDRNGFVVRGSGLGDIAVELDLRYVHPQAHGPSLPFRLGPRSAAWLGALLRPVVPNEMVVAPVAMSRLGEVDRAVAVLRAAGARGRGTTGFASLGLHFNIDPPRLDAETIIRFLKAFMLLEPRLRRETAAGSRLRRFFLPPPFPQAYQRQVLSPDYWPELPAFTDDYLRANPTRNRGLDLLPILLHFDEARVRSRLPYEKIGARPALHYRLPLAYVGESGWGIGPDWNRWMQVQRLVEQPGRLHELCRAQLRIPPGQAGWTWLGGIGRLAALVTV